MVKCNNREGIGRGANIQAQANISRPITAERLAALARLYEGVQASQLMDRTVDKLLAHEAEQARGQLAVLDADLAAFEQQYGLPST